MTAFGESERLEMESGDCSGSEGESVKKGKSPREQIESLYIMPRAVARDVPMDNALPILEAMA